MSTASTTAPDAPSHVPSQGEGVDQQGTSSSRHWKAPFRPAAGEEGATPYLQEKTFPKIEELLSQDGASFDTELVFGSSRDAWYWRGSTRAYDGPVAPDPTIPRTQHQKKAIVKLLFKAIKSVGVATDNVGMIRPFSEQRHDNRRVEVVCWSILEACVDRCYRGSLVMAYEPEKAKAGSSIKSFAERMNAIVEALSKEKTICKHLLDAPFINKFIDDPVGSKQRVESNRRLNKRKGGVMSAGKDAIAKTRGQSADQNNTPEINTIEESPAMSASMGASAPSPDDQTVQAGIFGAPDLHGGSSTLMPDTYVPLGQGALSLPANLPSAEVHHPVEQFASANPHPSSEKQSTMDLFDEFTTGLGAEVDMVTAPYSATSAAPPNRATPATHFQYIPPSSQSMMSMGIRIGNVSFGSVVVLSSVNFYQEGNRFVMPRSGFGSVYPRQSTGSLPTSTQYQWHGQTRSLAARQRNRFSGGTSDIIEEQDEYDDNDELQAQHSRKKRRQS